MPRIEHWENLATNVRQHLIDRMREPSSQAPLLGPGPLRTGLETFVLIRLKPCERLFEGDAASIRKGADGEPCRGTLDEVERGCPRSSNHPSREGRSGEGASP